VKPAPPVSAGAPNTAQAAGAVAFARDQIGDAYRFAGAGPSSWDCSGLTMQAYASVGIGIGGHSATAQYDLAKAQGKLVPYAQVQVGDLIFYTDGGGDMYHVAIYSGSGMMIEAPYPGVKVREVPVRAGDRVAKVARPTASAS
jgi:cell wall-associated NlpC family hydrolase